MLVILSEERSDESKDPYCRHKARLSYRGASTQVR